jgi:methylated-DNA-[protein]-cysteine S-methyltransferase
MITSDIHDSRVTPAMTFEEKVWAVTARIPKGKVATYGWVARQLKSTAYRAVGRALNRNPYAPAVPCHRVVGSSGALTGFAGGLEAKERLLKGEGVELARGKVDLKRFALV